VSPPQTGPYDMLRVRRRPPLNVRFASTSALVVIVRSDTQQGGHNFVVGLPQFRHGGNQLSRRCRRVPERFRMISASSAKLRVAEFKE